MRAHTVEMITSDDVSADRLEEALRAIFGKPKHITVIRPDDMNKLEKTWDDFDNAGDNVWDNIGEFGVQDFEEMYELSNKDAEILWAVVQCRVDPRRNINKCDDEKIGSMIKEALHQSLDGWTVEQGMIIEAFLADIAYAVNQEVAYNQVNDEVLRQIALDEGQIDDGLTDDEK